jgi:hypothetical protein
MLWMNMTQCYEWIWPYAINEWKWHHAIIKCNIKCDTLLWMWHYVINEWIWHYAWMSECDTML